MINVPTIYFIASPWALFAPRQNIWPSLMPHFWWHHTSHSSRIFCQTTWWQSRIFCRWQMCHIWPGLYSYHSRISYQVWHHMPRCCRFFCINTSMEYSASDKCAMCGLPLWCFAPSIQCNIALSTIFDAYSYIFLQFLPHLIYQHRLKQILLRHIDWQNGWHHRNSSCYFLAEYSAPYITLYDVSGSSNLCTGQISLLCMHHGYYSGLFSGMNFGGEEYYFQALWY